MAKKQPELPGCERVSLPDVDDAVERYLTARENTAGAREAERLAFDQLLGRLETNALDRYAYVDGEFLFVVRAVDEPKIKITKIKGEPDVGIEA